MKRFQKILFFLILTSMIFSFAYLFVVEPVPAFGDDCQYGWNSWPGNPCHWDHASNCVECNPKV